MVPEFGQPDAFPRRRDLAEPVAEVLAQHARLHPEARVRQDLLADRARPVADQLGEHLPRHAEDLSLGRISALGADRRGIAHPEDPDLGRPGVVPLHERGSRDGTQRRVQFGQRAHDRDAVAPLPSLGFHHNRISLAGHAFVGRFHAVGATRVGGLDELRQCARRVEGTQDLVFGFADDAAARPDPRVHTGPDRQRMVTDREPGEVGDEQRVEHPTRPPLMVQESAHGDNQPPPALSAREVLEDVEQQGDAQHRGDDHEQTGLADAGRAPQQDLGDEQREGGPEQDSDERRGAFDDADAPSAFVAEDACDEQAGEGDAEVEGAVSHEETGDRGGRLASANGEAEDDGDLERPPDVPHPLDEGAEPRGTHWWLEDERVCSRRNPWCVVAIEMLFEIPRGQCRLHDREEVAVLGHHQQARRDQLVMPLGGPVADERIVPAVQDESWGLQRLHDAAEGALVGVPEVSDERVAERTRAEEAEVRHEVGQHDDGGVSDGVLRVLEEETPRPFGLLYGDRREQRGRGDSARRELARVQGHRAAVRPSHDVRTVDVEFVHEREQVACVGACGIIPDPLG